MAPATALASVQITEIMYDPPAADTGREWVEITADAPVNLAGYKFFEANTNHGLMTEQGTTTLTAGESAIISNNPQKFLSDYPNYSGTLFKSSFSLSNTGEPLALKDTKPQPIDSVSYSSDGGASGDGNSLHRQNDSFVPGAPNPGSSALTTPIAKPKAAAASAKPPTSAAPKSAISKASSRSIAAAQAPLLDSLEMPPVPTGWNLALAVFLACAALVSLSLGVLLYMRALPMPVSAQDETKRLADEFELI